MRNRGYDSARGSGLACALTGDRIGLNRNCPSLGEAARNGGDFGAFFMI